MNGSFCLLEGSKGGEGQSTRWKTRWQSRKFATAASNTSRSAFALVCVCVCFALFVVVYCHSMLFYCCEQNQ